MMPKLPHLVLLLASERDGGEGTPLQPAEPSPSPRPHPQARPGERAGRGRILPANPKFLASLSQGKRNN